MGQSVLGGGRDLLNRARWWVLVGALSNLCIRGPKRRVIVDGTKVRCQKGWALLGDFQRMVVSVLGNCKSTCTGRRRNLHWNVNPPMTLFTFMYGKEWTLTFDDTGNVPG